MLRRRFFRNPVFANLALLLALLAGVLSWWQMPREQTARPSAAAVEIVTAAPGLATAEIETRVTAVLEAAIKPIADLDFIASTSRVGESRLTVRLRTVSEATFERRLNELRWIVQHVERQLPSLAGRPEIASVHGAGVLPSADVLVLARAPDAPAPYAAAERLAQSFERLMDVERVERYGTRATRVEIRFDPERVARHGLTPARLAELVGAQLREQAVGRVDFDERPMQLLVEGADLQPERLAQLPVPGVRGLQPLAALADIERGPEPATRAVLADGRPAVLLSVYRKSDANALDLSAALGEQAARFADSDAEAAAIELRVLDARSTDTRRALQAYERGALPALAAALLVFAIAFGWRLAMLVACVVPAAVGLALAPWGFSGGVLTPVMLTGVLAGFVLLIDAAVAVGERLQHRLLRGAAALDAAYGAWREAGLPLMVATLVFLLAMLLPMWLPEGSGPAGALAAQVMTGMLVAGIAYAVLLLPSHAVVTRIRLPRRHPVQARREWLAWRLRHAYRRLLNWTLRRPLVPGLVLVLLLLGALVALGSGRVGVEFAERGQLRSFYVNLELSPGAKLEDTLAAGREVERIVREQLPADALAEVVISAGLRRSERELLTGERHGQVLVGLRSGDRIRDALTVEQAITRVKPRLAFVGGVDNLSVQAVDDGRPVARPLSVTVRGDDPAEVRRAADRVVDILRSLIGVTDVVDDEDQAEAAELRLVLKPGALLRAGLSAPQLLRELRLLGEGETIAQLREQGRNVDVLLRGKAAPEPFFDIEEFLARPVRLPDGRSAPLGEFASAEPASGRSVVRHQNLRRAISIEADVDQARVNTFALNRVVVAEWERTAAAGLPGVELVIGGAFGSVAGHLGALVSLFALGSGLGYLVLATRAHSYRQPLVIFAAVPFAALAFVVGLAVSGQPVGPYTGFAGTALLGLSVQSTLLLVSAVQRLLPIEGSVARAVALAAADRALPVLVSALASVAGLAVFALGVPVAAPAWMALAGALIGGIPVIALCVLLVLPAICLYVLRAPVSAVTAINVVDAEPGGGSWRERMRRGRRHAAIVALNESELNSAEPELRARHEAGLDALKVGEWLQALRLFEDAAKRHPEAVQLQFGATQALLQYLFENEWDEGYHARAGRHLARARQLASGDPRLRPLERALAELEARHVPVAGEGAGSQPRVGMLRLSGTVGRPWRPASVARGQRAPDRGTDLPAGLHDLALALRNLVRQRKRTAAALGAIGFGAVALILAGGFIEWVLWATRESAVYGQLGHVQVVRQDFFVRGTADPRGFLIPGDAPPAGLRELPHVRAVTPRLSFSGLASTGETTVPYLGQGVVPEDEAPISIDYRIVSGKGLTTSDAREVIVGTGLAATLGVKPGQKLILMSNSGSGAFTPVELKVRGLFSTSNKALNDVALRVPLKTAQDLLQVDGVHIWVVLLDRTESTAAVLPQLRALLPAGLQAVPWSDLADFYNKTSELFQRQMFVLRLMIAVIILLSISNSLMMNVMERTGEIGTLCALGTRRRSILKIFSLEALALGLLGAATGTALGVTIASVASAVGIPMPPAPGMDKGFVAEILVTPALAGSTFGLAVIATFVSGLYPAWKASRLVIVDALRHNR